MKWEIGALVLATAMTLGAAGSGVVIYSASDLKAQSKKLSDKGGQFSSQDLARYGNHYMMLAHREKTGSSELHQHEADIFVVQEGEATILTGGKLVNAHTEKAGELRGTSIVGGESRTLSIGDVIHIPAGTPHQLLLDKGKPFTYFVIKVTGQ